MNELVSIIMPVYNSEKYINQSILSVLNQTYSNFELIIINDGSTDNSKKVCEQYLEKDSRIHFFDKKNEGVAKTRNFGIEKANGKYLMFIDSDDIFEENMIEKMLKTSIDFDADIVRCSYRNLSNLNNKIAEKIDDGVYEAEQIYDNLISELLKENLKGYIWNLLIKKEIVEKFDEDLFIYEDLLFCLNTFFKSKRIYCLDLPLYIYNDLNTDSLTKRDYEKNIHNIIRAEKSIIRTLEKFNCMKYRSFIDTRIVTNIVNYVYLIQFFYSKKKALKCRKELLANSNFIQIYKNYASNLNIISFKEKMLNYAFFHNFKVMFYILCFIKNLKNRRFKQKKIKSE